MRPLRALAAAVLLAVAWGCGDDAGERLTEEERTRRVLEARTAGEAALQQDRVDEAREAFGRLVALAPEEATGYASLALVHLRAGELDEAERLVRQALERAPDDPGLHRVLARIREARGDAAGARRRLERAVELDPRSLEAHYGLAELHAPDGAVPDTAARLTHLGRIVELAPANEAARAELAMALLASGRTDSAAAHLEALRAQLPELPGDVTRPLDDAIASAVAGRPGGALEAARRFADQFRVTQTYQAAARDLRGPRGTMSGFPALRFSHELTLQAREQGAVYGALRFAEATAAAGLAGPAGPAGAGPEAPGGPAAGAVVAPGDFDADDDRDLLVAEPAEGGSRLRLLRSDLGRFVDVTGGSGLAAAVGAEAPDPDGAAAAGGPAGVPAGGTVWDARFGDLDNDGFLDLWIVRSGRDLYLRNRGDGTFEDATDAAGVSGGGDGRAVVFADLDTDGDLDVFVAGGGPDRLWRNDGDGTFTELGSAWGVAGDPAAEGRDVAFADLDDDGDLDLLVANADAPSALHSNLRGGRFEDRARRAGLARPAGVVEAGDVDNDGRVDLLLAGPADPPAPGAAAAAGGAGPGPTLYRNRGGLRFEPAAGLPGAAGPPPSGGAFLDFDNDGHRDLILVGGRPAGGPGDGRAVRLLHNRGDGTFEPASDKLPAAEAAASPAATPGGAPLPPEPPGGFAGVAVADYNEDGDADLFLAGRRGGFRLWRNDGGDANHHIRLELTGLARGNGKVNRNGIGSRVEVRAGDLFQVATVRDPVTTFGLGHRLKADVIRIEWTNGVPQSLYYPGTDEDLREEQTLKGSCAFLYAWDGDGFELVTDVVWKSAIGMPVGIMGASDAASGSAPPHGTAPDGSGAPGAGEAPAAPEERRVHASPAASREYVRVPGEALRARDGVYGIRLTEELWETAYLDEVKLLAVDHPDSVEVFVDERFVPPGPPALRIYRVARRHLPVAARDGRGNDLLPALRAADDVHVSNLVPGRWQGITRLHDLVLDLGEAARTDSVFLFLQGWVFPTDASVNVAMAQAGVRPRPPVLEVRDGAGDWVTVRPDLSFPSGKEKTVIADLTGAWRSESREVRIRTDMEVYWDHAFFATGPGVAGPVVRSSAEGLVAGGAAETRVREAAARGVRLLAEAEAAASPPSDREGPSALAAAARASYGGAARRAGDLRVTVLRPVRADLRVRGFSRTYRKGGRHGPHWFDYDHVSAASPWLPIDGRFTRTGDVGPLLLAADDLYAILAPGDEAAVEFSAASAPEPPPGWTRDFLLYTVGWIKDADRNTAEGHRVGPLPRHGLSAYPPPDGERRAFPGDGLTGLWDRALNTRRAPPSDVDTAAPAPGG